MFRTYSAIFEMNIRTRRVARSIHPIGNAQTPRFVILLSFASSATDDQKAPQQNNGSDCGIFTCQTLELVARGADPIDKGFEFSQTNMPFFRQLMTYETATGKLKKRW